MERRIGFYSALIPAALITFAHFSISTATNLPNSEGVIDRGLLPSSASRTCIAGSARMRWARQRCRAARGKHTSIALMMLGAPSEVTSSGSFRPRDDSFFANSNRVKAWRDNGDVEEQTDPRKALRGDWMTHYGVQVRPT
jgi:hypothetical protein